jgi:hypothetical protein
LDLSVHSGCCKFVVRQPGNTTMIITSASGLGEFTVFRS